MKIRTRGRRTARIEIIPMIDVVFFLLVFFMMASLSMTVNRGLPVKLPAAASGERARPEPVSVTVTRAGEIYVDRDPTTPEALVERLRRRAAGNPDLVVIVNADRDVEHGRVVSVMDAARRGGVTRLAIAVAPGDVPGRRP